MALKRAKGSPGTLVVLEHDSRILKGNPLGDPHVRKLAVWLPPQYDDAARGAALPGALRPGRLHRLRPRARRLEAVRRQRPGARRAPDPRAEDGTGDHRVPGLLHRARRQPVREFVGDRQLRRLPRRARSFPSSTASSARSRAASTAAASASRRAATARSSTA